LVRWLQPGLSLKVTSSSPKVGLSLTLFVHIIGFALFVFWLLLIARVVVEFVRSFSRDWHPHGLTVVILEIILSVTDPPVRLLRRLIPQLTVGAVRFDLSIMVLLLVAFIGMTMALDYHA
jgi:YggT family protein